jgi:hypothetical protein
MNMLKLAQFILACIATAMLVSCTEPMPPNLLLNSSFEELTEKQKPVAWGHSQHAGKVAYTYQIDTEVAFDGMQSYRIEQYAKQAYGIVKQSLVLSDRKSKTFSFTAMLKTKDVVAGNGWKLVLNCRGSNNNILKQFQSEPMNGSTDWQKVSLEGDIPKGTVKFGVGIMLMSQGAAWVDATYFSVK